MAEYCTVPESGGGPACHFFLVYTWPQLPALSARPSACRPAGLFGHAGPGTPGAPPPKAENKSARRGSTVYGGVGQIDPSVNRNVRSVQDGSCVCTAACAKEVDRATAPCPDLAACADSVRRARTLRWQTGVRRPR